MENKEIKNYHKKICEKLITDYIKMAETGKCVFNFNNTKFVDDLYEKVKQKELGTKDFFGNLMRFYNYIEKKPDKTSAVFKHIYENYSQLVNEKSIVEEYKYALKLLLKNNFSKDTVKNKFKCFITKSLLKNNSGKDTIKRREKFFKKIRKIIKYLKKNISDKSTAQVIK